MVGYPSVIYYWITIIGDELIVQLVLLVVNLRVVLLASRSPSNLYAHTVGYLSRVSPP